MNPRREGTVGGQVTHDVDAGDEHVGKEEGGHATQHSIGNGGDGSSELPGWFKSLSQQVTQEQDKHCLQDHATQHEHEKYGRCLHAAPSLSKQPRTMSQKQQAMPAAREAQRVMAITPLFCEKVVLGGPPARMESDGQSRESQLQYTIHFLQLCRPSGKSSSRPGNCSRRRQAGRPGYGSRHLGPRWAGH